MRTLVAGRRWKGLLAAAAVLLVAAGILHRRDEELRTESSMPAAKAVVAVQQFGSGERKTVGENAVKPFNGAVSPLMFQTVSKNTAKVYYRDKVAVLTYHHLDPQESSVTITPERFESHLEMLKNRGFHVIPIEQFIDFLKYKKPVPPNAVVLTFDDGYESVYRYAYPLLQQEGMTATFFLIVGYIEDGAPHFPPILNWQEIEEMHGNGFSFYSHTYHSHESVFVKGKELSELTTKIVNPATGRLETDQEYRARIGADLAKADDMLRAKLGNQLNLLCLPHGQYNKTVIQAANQDGIPYLFTGTEGLNTNKETLIKRINAGSPYMTDKLLLSKLMTSK